MDKGVDIERTSPLEKSCQLLRKIYDDRHGSILIYKDNTNKKLIYCKEVQINQKSQVVSQIKRIKTLQQINSKYVASVLDYSVLKQSDLCATFYLLKVFSEFKQKDLKKEMTERRTKQFGFSSEELVHLLYQTTGALKDFEVNNCYHGDLRPDYIGIEKRHWNFKLIPRSLEVQSKEDILRIQKFRVKNNDDLYMSPKLFTMTKHNNSINDINNLNPIKEDVFSLGLLFLEISTGQNIKDLYKEGKFDEDLFRKFKANFERKFAGVDNRLFNSSVVSMLERDETKRLTFSQLSKRMPEYKVVVDFMRSKRKRQSTPEAKTYYNKGGFNNSNVVYSNNFDKRIVVNKGLANPTQSDKNGLDRKDRRGWKTDVQHIIKRVDKSTDKPDIEPYHDKFSHNITFKHPFTEQGYHIVYRSNDRFSGIKRSRSQIDNKMRSYYGRYGEDDKVVQIKHG